MQNKAVWFVRAGRKAAFVDSFISDGLAALGFGGVGPIDPGASNEEIAAQVEKANPRAKPGSRAAWAAQLKRWTREVKVGDAVVTYNPTNRIYFLGTITSELEWREHDLPRARKVQWKRRAARDSLSQRTKNSLGSIATLFQVADHAWAELDAAAIPLNAPETELPIEVKPAEVLTEVESESILLDEVAEKASTLIEDQIAALAPDEMQELVAGILRAMGYKTRVSAAGPDRGVDVTASPDGLGLQEPRIFVEVKHRTNSTMGAPQIRAFLGGRQAQDRCLYVSTGGFSKDARYEAERSQIPITLIALPELRELLVEHYEKLDVQSRQLVPLVRLYWPAD